MTFYCRYSISCPRQVMHKFGRCMKVWNEYEHICEKVQPTILKVIRLIFFQKSNFLCNNFLLPVLPLLLTVAWATGMSLNTTDIFWDNYSNSYSIFIIVVPMIMALSANLVILILIMRVVVIKLRIQRSLSTQQLQVDIEFFTFINNFKYLLMTTTRFVVCVNLVSLG